MIRINTLVKLKYTNDESLEEVLQIEKVEELLGINKAVEVWTPSGWARIEEFVKSQEAFEFAVHVRNGYVLNCGGKNFVKTHFGWMTVAEIFELNQRSQFIHVRTTKGYLGSTVHKTGEKINTVNVKFKEDGSYWANGLEVRGLS